MGANTIMANLSVLDAIHKATKKEQEIIKKSQTGKAVIFKQVTIMKNTAAILNEMTEVCDNFIGNKITDKELKREMKRLNLKAIKELKKNVIL